VFLEQKYLLPTTIFNVIYKSNTLLETQNPSFLVGEVLICAVVNRSENDRLSLQPAFERLYPEV